MSTATFHVGDAFEQMAKIPDRSVDLIVTSPPFLALRSYLPAGHPDKGKEIGSEATPAAFLATLLALTREWRRVLAPHGSIAVELGDTYSGNGNGFALPDGYDRSAGRRAPGGQPYADTFKGGGPGGAGWPLDKSLCLLPTLYPASLAYGRNLLDPDDVIDPWRIRNLIVWHRPNPPVGALGDKVRPSTSYVTVACTRRDRWFDLDAERTEHKQPDGWQRTGGAKYQGAQETDGVGPRFAVNVGNPAGAPPLDFWTLPEDDPPQVSYVTIAAMRRDRWFDLDAERTEHACADWSRPRLGEKDIANPDRGTNSQGTGGNPAGAPPLDYWRFEDDPAEHQAWTIPTQPYAGSHYATFPIALPRRLIRLMCPQHVCRTCGEPRRRIVGEAEYVGSIKDGARADGIISRGGRSVAGTTTGSNSNLTRQAPTLGWSDCGHDDYRRGVVLDPFAGSGTTLAAATEQGRDAIGIDLDADNYWLARERVGMFLTDAG